MCGVLRRGRGDGFDKVKLSFSTNAFTRFSLCEAVAKIAAAGYAGVEILADMPHLFAAPAAETELPEVQRALRDAGIQAANLNANTAIGYYGRGFWEPLFEPSLAHPEEKERRWRISYTKKVIDFAAILCAPAVSVTSGRPVPGCSPEKGLLLLRDSLAEILDYAGDLGIQIGLEYEPGLLIENCDELAPFLDVMDHPWLGANLDLGHSHLLGEEAEAVISRLGEKIFHVHLEDIRDRKHFHLIPGLGDINFQQVLASLHKQYDGFVTVELYTYPQAPEEAAARARVYLEQFPVWS
ncbi:MAG: sugar phosphate isomerase/epimerase [Deltaproteobacteria bacterium]|nr:sugar phosphate isomerase/epimerase [Deltaproteobacteria bacterium]